MNIKTILFAARSLALLCALAATAFSAQAATAQSAEIYNMSLRFQRSTAVEATAQWTLDFTTALEGARANGELALAQGVDPFTHASFVILANVTRAFTNYYPISLNIPTEDSDRNGVFDVLEEQRVGAITSGRYVDSSGISRLVHAAWSKEAGASSGLCNIEIPHLSLSFNASFENIHYSGVYYYTKAEANLTGQLSVSRVGMPASTLAGPLNLRIVNESLLAWGLGQWATESGGAILYEGSDLDRTAPLEYSGFYVANDGDLTTALADYQTWLLVLPNIPDNNANGTPDLIEATVAPRPRLTLTISGNALTLTVTGANGRTFNLQTKSSIDPNEQWEGLGSYTFSSDSQTIPLIMPNGGTAFFQLKE